MYCTIPGRERLRKKQKRIKETERGGKGKRLVGWLFTCLCY